MNHYTHDLQDKVFMVYLRHSEYRDWPELWSYVLVWSLRHRMCQGACHRQNLFDGLCKINVTGFFCSLNAWPQAVLPQSPRLSLKTSVNGYKILCTWNSFHMSVFAGPDILKSQTYILNYNKSFVQISRLFQMILQGHT